MRMYPLVYQNAGILDEWRQTLAIDHLPSTIDRILALVYKREEHCRMALGLEVERTRELFLDAGRKARRSWGKGV